MSMRLMLPALRPLGRHRSSAFFLHASYSRQLFSSTAHNAFGAVFTDTENENLNKIFKEIQEKIILPAYLPEKQRKIIFDPKKRSYLEENPIVIEVDGLEHQFSSIDRFTEIENSKKAFLKAIENMQTAEDWANLGTLLSGYKKAGIKLKASQWGKLVRLAGTRGHIYTIIECAKQSDKTGLKLRTLEVVAGVLAYVNDKIAKSAGDAAETKQALKWVELILDLLLRSEHTLDAQQTQERLHFSRLIRGMVLYARASAVKTDAAAQGGLDLLKDEVALLASLWADAINKDMAEISEFAELNPVLDRSKNRNRNKTSGGLNGSAYVRVLAQNIKGIQLAQEILGQEGQLLTPILNALDSHLQDLANKSEQRRGGWAKEYEKIVGEKPNWPAINTETASTS